MFIINVGTPKKTKRVSDKSLKEKAHTLKERTLKNPTLRNIDRKISHYDIYQDAADGGRLWLNKKDDR